MIKQILITVKTYPTYSSKYDELVCTAGVDKDGNWWRLYPMPFRSLHDTQQYKKYDWIEVDIQEHTGDPRPESFRVKNLDDLTSVRILGNEGTADHWSRRAQYALRNVYTNLGSLIEDSDIQGPTKRSLATFKPARIIKCFSETNDNEMSAKDKAAFLQGSLFGIAGAEPMLKAMPRIPYRFKYTFEDDEGRSSTMTILDWETGQLYLNELRRGKTEKQARDSVIAKYETFMQPQFDTHFFLGTTQRHHGRALNPFTIIGVYYPKKRIQMGLFG